MQVEFGNYQELEFNTFCCRNKQTRVTGRPRLTERCKGNMKNGLKYMCCESPVGFIWL